MPPYPEVDPTPDFPRVEREALAFWEADDTFRASVEQRPPGPPPEREYVFYDGPPFANGLPHYGHLLTGYAKDVVPRYRTMRGQRVERVFGWDCHGLPAEIEVERELGVSGHAAIGEFGIERFNDACRASVLKYTSEWRRYVVRQGRWVDFDNDYKTMDLSYMESVIWAFKRLYDSGLLYEGYRVLPYCWECETPLSNTETRLDDAYRDREDPAITVSFELETGELALVWTTTPWTLPSNLALAVSPELDYAVHDLDGRRYLMAAAAAERYAERLEGARQVGTRRGADLVGTRYTPLFDFFADQPNAFRVVPADFVSADEGTGIVHTAPAFGEDDQRICEAADIRAVNPVDRSGRFTQEVPPYAGKNVLEANADIIRDLGARGALFADERIVHSYPHCWRSGTPLIYKAVDSWMVDVGKLKEKALELNQEISWVPAHVRDGAFGKWLENARDWSISRNRYWGAPIPVWKSDDPRHPRIDVYGSLDELERDFGVRPEDLHRPHIDELTRPNPDDPSGRSTMRRVEEVLDCWFESGSMPFAQVHYPFERKEWFDTHFPADFIVEYIGQTRGWFYTLHVLATALFERPPFTAAISHGIVLGSDGQKMSKSLRNYPDPYDVFDTYGSDAMRWFLLASPLMRGQNLVVKEEAIADVRRLVLNPIWSSWRFFTLYANAADYRGRFRTDMTDLLDRYALAKLRELVESVTAALDAYDLAGAYAAVDAFLDALTNWYIRRNRDRFWGEDADAFDTLHTVLEVFCRTAAPLLPFLAEHVWKGLTGERSVHLSDWPAAEELPHDPELVARMDRVREICSTAVSVRKAHRLRVRLPLAKVTVAAPDAADLEPLKELIADEVNVKEVELTSDMSGHATTQVGLNMRLVGPRLGKAAPKVLAAAREGDVEHLGDGRVRIAGEELGPDEYVERIVPTDDATTQLLPSGEGVVVVDTELTPELEREGLARDVTRLIQIARKDAGLDVSDRIELWLAAPDDVAEAIRAHRDFVSSETLATVLAVGDGEPGGNGARAYSLPDGRELRVAVTRSG